MKRLISVLLMLTLLLGSCSFGFAAVTVGEGKNAVTYSYKTAKLTEFADSSVNPYDAYGLRIKVSVPNYLGSIEAELETTEGSGTADVMVIYVPDEKWDGDCYYGGITASVSATQEYHVFSGAEAIVGWKEWYTYGFLPTDGGIYVYDKDAVQLNFLQGPGLYTGYATLPFSTIDLGTEDFMEALVIAPEYVGMTALGYPFVLVLNDETIKYFLENGTLDDVASYGWPGLAELLEEQKYVVGDKSSAQGFQNFVKKDAYYEGLLADLFNDESWYMPYVSTIYEYGLMEGYADSTFRPSGDISLAEIITIAAKINDIYNGGSGEFTSGKTWYSVFVNYAIGRGIITEDDFDGDYNRKATRGEISYILAHALPDEAYPKLATAGYAKDINPSTKYYDEIIKLYEANILSGYPDGSFFPDRYVSRAEVATMLVKVIDESMRKDFE